MIAWDSTMSPPPPAPWTARQAMSWPIVWDVPARTEPARKMTMQAMKRVLRPKRSPSLPQSTVVAVLASM
jgi:hypothetical protein